MKAFVRAVSDPRDVPIVPDAVSTPWAAISTRGPETLRDLAEETGAHAVIARDAARFGDRVIVTIPQAQVPRLPSGLDESWRQQPGTPVYVTDHDASGVRRALGDASRERPAAFRATDASPGTFAAPT